MGHPGRPRKCEPAVYNLRMNIYSNDFDGAKATLKEFGIDATDGEGRTALLNSVIENKVDFIYWLVENGANVNHQDRIGYSALHFIAEKQMADMAKYFLDKGSNPNLQDIHGNTPLWTAVFNSKETKDIVTLLVRSGANPDIVNKYDKTPRIMFQTFYNNDIPSF